MAVAVDPRRVLRKAWSRKDVPPSTEVGWSNPLWGSASSQSILSTRMGSAARLTHLMNTYGGTDESVTWVFACISLIASTGASYDHTLVKPRTRDVVENGPDDLENLLEQPNREITYFDWMEDIFIDLELVGNSYWLLDQQNGLGQPFEMLRMHPQNMQVVVDNMGRKSGYVYSWIDPNNPGRKIQVPYKLGDIMHYRTRNPLSPYYGMGTVEALIREIESELSQTVHVNAFFQNGARISGILSSADPLSDVQFNRIVQQFNAEYAGAENAYKMLIADGATKFEPVTQPPAQLGVVDLRKLSKDAILSGFGVPEFLLGGAAQAGVYKMEEAQNIFYRGMMPRARRVEERTSLDLTSRWKLGFDILTGATEPRSIRVARAKEMVGTGATLNQILKEQDLPVIDRPEGDIPLLPGGLVPWYDASDVPAPPIPINNQNAAAITGDEGGGPATPGQPHSPPAATFALTGIEGKKIIVARQLPDGFEKIGDIQAPDREKEVSIRHMVDGQADFFFESTPAFRSSFIEFFGSQRSRALERLAGFGNRGVRNPDRAKYAGRQSLNKKDLAADSGWNDEVEDAALRQYFLDLIDKWGTDALKASKYVTGSQIQWDRNDPRIVLIREKMAELVRTVNETTKAAVEEQIEIGIKRSYSTLQIANGFPAEDYAGVAGAFDTAIAKRVDQIARTEVAKLFNFASLTTFKEDKRGSVLVFDGVEFDDGCRNAAGSTWTVDEALSAPIEHPNCTRFFIPAD